MQHILDANRLWSRVSIRATCHSFGCTSGLSESSSCATYLLLSVEAGSGKGTANLRAGLQAANAPLPQESCPKTTLILASPALMQAHLLEPLRQASHDARLQGQAASCHCLTAARELAPINNGVGQQHDVSCHAILCAERDYCLWCISNVTWMDMAAGLL